MLTIGMTCVPPRSESLPEVLEPEPPDVDCVPVVVEPVLFESPRTLMALPLTFTGALTSGLTWVPLAVPSAPEVELEAELDNRCRHRSWPIQRSSSRRER